MSSSNCCFLTCMQVSQEAGQVVWYSHLFHNSPQSIEIHTVKGFGIVNKAEIDVFLKLSCFFDDPADVGNLISGSSAGYPIEREANFYNFLINCLIRISSKLCSSLDILNCVLIVYLHIKLFPFQSTCWHPILVLLPGKYHGQRSLVGCNPWGHKESDTTEVSEQAWTVSRCRKCTLYLYSFTKYTV